MASLTRSDGKLVNNIFVSRIKIILKRAAFRSIILAVTPPTTPHSLTNRRRESFSPPIQFFLECLRVRHPTSWQD